MHANHAAYMSYVYLVQICEAFGGNRYPFPEEPARQRQMNAEVTARLRELHTTIEAGQCRPATHPSGHHMCTSWQFCLRIALRRVCSFRAMLSNSDVTVRMLPRCSLSEASEHESSVCIHLLCTSTSQQLALFNARQKRFGDFLLVKGHTSSSGTQINTCFA